MHHSLLKNSVTTYCVRLTLIYRQAKRNYRSMVSVHQLAELKHTQFIRRLAKRNRVFFSWFFRLVPRLPFRSNNVGGCWRLGERLAVQRVSGSRTQEQRRTARILLQQVGPKLNLRVNALVVRLCKHGHRGRARRMVEVVLGMLGEQLGENPSVILNSVLLSLEPPFEVRAFRRRWGVTYYPAPIWPYRKYFLAVKILVKGACYYQQQSHCPFVVALCQEILAIFTNQRDCFSRKIYRKLIRVGVRHKFRWRRFVRSL